LARGSNNHFVAGILDKQRLSIFMQGTEHSNQGIDIRPSTLRICGVIIGYSISLFGALSLFSVQLYISFLSLFIGAAFIMLASRTVRTNPSMTLRSWIILIAGCSVILAVFYMFGDEQVRHWRPHPVGYVPAWFTCFHAFRQIRYMLSRRASDTRHVA
jgi:hypothetical protein